MDKLSTQGLAATSTKGKESKQAKHSTKALPPRVTRTLRALLVNPLTGKEVEQAAPCRYAGHVIYAIRNLGIDIHNEQVPHVTVDGVHTTYVRYHLADSSQDKAIKLVEVQP